MDRMVNCPNDVLVELCHDESWYKIVKHRNHVRIPDKNPIDIKTYVKDEPRNEWEILDRDGVNIHDMNFFAKDAIDYPVKMLKHPSDLYLYSSPKKTDEAMSLYGVMAVSSVSGSSKCLKRHWKYDVEHGEKYSWHDFLKKYHTGAIPPSNALVIIDRYLFSDNAEYRTDYKNGIRNVFDLAQELLPLVFRGEYHVLIVFDDKKISPDASLRDVVNGLQTIKGKIQRPYTIVFEILAISSSYSNMDMYSETHDRRILSNYFTIHSTHGFSAFQPEEEDEDLLISDSSCYASWSQRLTFESVYAGIDDEDQDLLSLPIRTNERSLSLLKDFIKGRSGNNRGVKYIRDGKYNLDIRSMKNRLVVS